MSAFPETPAKLLAKMAARGATCEDDVAWAKFAELYAPVMRAYFLSESGVTPTEADDLVQDLFVRLVNVIRTGGYDSAKSRFRTFLVSVMRHILIDRHRRRMADRADRRDQLEDDVKVDPQPDAAALVDIRWRMSVRSAVIDHVFTRTAISPQHRDIYRTYVLEGVSAKETAARFGVTEAFVRQVKTRIGRMIAALEREYVD